MNKNEVTIFNHEEFGRIRTLIIDDEPWFSARDVAKALGYEKSRNAISIHVDEEDKFLLDAETQPQIRAEFNYKKLGQRGGWLINESGSYSLSYRINKNVLLGTVPNCS